MYCSQDTLYWHMAMIISYAQILFSYQNYVFNARSSFCIPFNRCVCYSFLRELRYDLYGI